MSASPVCLLNGIGAVDFGELTGMGNDALVGACEAAGHDDLRSSGTTRRFISLRHPGCPAPVPHHRHAFLHAIGLGDRYGHVEVGPAEADLVDRLAQAGDLGAEGADLGGQGPELARVNIHRAPPVRTANHRSGPSAPNTSASAATSARPWPSPGHRGKRGGSWPWSVTSTRTMPSTAVVRAHRDLAAGKAGSRVQDRVSDQLAGQQGGVGLGRRVMEETCDP